ncbi:hypothetical protein [Flavobacterium tructae]|uniref:Tetratricopeptide repeat protein n=1 Tax=Flavobacterium tructae TaxID=1114873 RepID=A0ABX4D781_9FLAO|nr:hypothetical protein [Flavobacterium tructae]OXB19747.1 hypothetical protein B0A71_09880 [Flavobacterium tructae]
MRKVVVTSLIILINIVFINATLGQNQIKYKTYNQDDFEKNKVSDEIYNLWIGKSNWFSALKDSISYFVDDRNYKGIINYGVSFRSKNYRNFNFVEHLSMCFLKVEVTKCDYNPKDNVLSIEGFVSGNNNWGWNVFLKGKKEKKYVDIFLGEKTDTLRNCYLGKIVNKDSIEVKLNNKETNEFTVLDKFPAFYFKKYSHYRTILGSRLPFKISGEVTSKTLLVFGSGETYSEIFDLGAMIFDPKKNERRKAIKKQELDCRPILSGNKRVADIEKEKAQKQEINYYTYTQNAENYILARQYGKAKEQYNLLAQKYPILFARDIHNAIRCAILSRDYKNAFWWGEKLALKGIELSYFNTKIFNGLRKNPEWTSFSVKYDSVSKNAQHKWNLNLKKELTNLLNEDQAEYGLENRKSPKVLYETTEKVTGKLIDLLKKEGYPSEEKIGSLVVRDTVLIPFPGFNALIIHATQKKPENLAVLNEILDKSSKALEYDDKRNFNNALAYSSCFRIYKGNLYSSKSCGRNDLEVRKISFKFSNPNNFIMDYGNFIIEAHDTKYPKEVDDDYEQNYNLIMKLTDDWEFYEK